MRALILDDGELNNLLMVEALRPLVDCQAHDFTRPADALAFAQAHGPEIGVVITDFDMPGMNGVAFIRAVRQVPGLAHTPIVMVTSIEERSLRREALEAGATDFLNKPCDPVEIRARVANLLALSRAYRAQQDHAALLEREVAAAVATVEAREREIITLLMRAAEHRDTDTGDHVARVAAYVGLTAEALGFPPDTCRQISLASTMHDVGKIGVPDAILLKPGPLSPEERAVMERHVERGQRILEISASPTVRLAAEIAATHHERWDGGGYPKGLAGTAIPLPGRIAAVADVFDALTSERPYKAAWEPERARDYLVEQAGTHFDAQVVEAFLSRWPQVLALCTTPARDAA